MNQSKVDSKSNIDSQTINWKQVHLNYGAVNDLIRNSDKKKKYCTLGHDFFSQQQSTSGASSLTQSQKLTQDQKDFESPLKGRSFIIPKVQRESKTTQNSMRGVFNTPQLEAKKNDYKRESSAELQNGKDHMKDFNLEPKDQSRHFQSIIDQVNDQINPKISFGKLFTINKTFVEQKNQQTKKNDDIFSKTQEINRNKPIIGMHKKDSNSLVQFKNKQQLISPLKKVRLNTANSQQFFQDQNTKYNSNSIEQIIKDNHLSVKNSLFQTCTEQFRTQNKFQYKEIQSLPNIPSQSVEPHQRIKKNLDRDNLPNVQGTEPLKNRMQKTSEQIFSLNNSAKQGQFFAKSENDNRLSKSTRKVSFNNQYNSQRHQYPKSLNAIDHSFEESINITDINNDPAGIPSLQNIEMPIDKNKLSTQGEDTDTLPYKKQANTSEKNKKIQFSQPKSLNYIDGYLEQSKLYRESISNIKDDSSVIIKKLPSNSMSNIINKCFTSQSKYPVVTLESILGGNNQESPQKNISSKNQSIISNKSMTRVDTDSHEQKISPLLSPLIDGKIQFSTQKYGKFILNQETQSRKESNSTSTANNQSGKTTKPQSILNSPQIAPKDSRSLNLIDTCFGGISYLNKFLDNLQNNYEHKVKRNQFEFINDKQISFNDGPIKDLIYLSLGVQLRDQINYKDKDIEQQKQYLKHQFKVLGICQWEMKEIKRYLFSFMSENHSLLNEDLVMLKQQFNDLEDQIFKWRIYDELEKFTVGDIAYKIKNLITLDPVTQQILMHFSFMENSDQFEQLLTVAFTTKDFSQYIKIISDALQPLNWTHADIMCVKLSVYKIFSQNFKFSKLSLVTFLDFIERMRYTATSKPDFFVRLQERDNDYNTFFGNVYRQCFQYILAFQSSKDQNNTKQLQGHPIVNQQYFFSQQVQQASLQNNIMTELYLTKFIETLFFGSLETSLFDVIKSEKFEKIISPATFPTIKKIILNQLDFYVCPEDYLLEIKKKLRLLKIQLGLKQSFNQELLSAFQSSESDQYKGFSINEAKDYFYKQIVTACTLNQALHNQQILGSGDNISIFAITLTNFIFDIIVDKNFPSFVSFYDCLGFSQVFTVQSFYYEEFAFILKGVISKLFTNQQYVEKFTKRIDRSMNILVQSVSKFD